MAARAALLALLLAGPLALFLLLRPPSRPSPTVLHTTTAAPGQQQPFDMEQLRCPPGAYAGNASAVAARLTQLRAHWQRLLELGYVPSGDKKAARRRAAARGFITYESSLWPRPAYCRSARRSFRLDRKLPQSVVDEPPGTCEPNGTVCDKYRISHAFKFIWHHVWKGGTTSLSPYLTCNFQAEPTAGLLRTRPPPPADYLHVGTSREPLRRFISAFQEVYLRVRVRAPPPPSQPAAPPPPKCYHRNVPWMLVAMRQSGHRHLHPHVCTDASTALNRTALRALFRQFVADLECSTRFPNSEHLYSQALFLGANTSRPQRIDTLLRLESLAADVAQLKRAVGYGNRKDACPLTTERSAADKPRAVPHASTLLALLRDEPGLLQSVCNVYMQDFICLGYPLPKGCELLPPRAAHAPKTMRITAASVFGEKQIGGRHGRRKKARRGATQDH